MGNFDGKQAPKEVTITSEYITLGQLLKFVDLIDNGGMAKVYLATNEVLVNGVPESRRGRKLRPGDKVAAGGKNYLIESK